MADPEAVGKVQYYIILCAVMFYSSLPEPCQLITALSCSSTTPKFTQAFAEHYYSTFDTNRTALVGLYQENSILTFEGSKVQGSQAIAAKLTSLPFQQCQHKVSSLDVQPSISGGIVVFVTGQLLVL